MRLSSPAALLLACVTSLLIWPLQQAHVLIYRGCAYKPVLGKEHALWFCMADNLCSIFYCQDNNVFSVDDCGCVPPHHRPKTPPGGAKPDPGGVTEGGPGGSTMAVTSAGHTTTSPVVLSAGGNIITSVPQADPACQREVEVQGVTATGADHSSLYVEPRGVVDKGNGSAYYDGYSYLALPLYTSAAFPAGFSVHFVVEEGTSTLRQVLMTNCKHGQGASVEIVLDVNLGVVLFHVMYRFRQPANKVESVVEVAVPYTAFVPKRVAMVFDGVWLRGRVNSNERSARVQGNGDYVIAQRPKPLMFGNTMCDVDDVYSYRGQIKQISLYRCVKNMTDFIS